MAAHRIGWLLWAVMVGSQVGCAWSLHIEHHDIPKDEGATENGAPDGSAEDEPEDEKPENQAR